MLRLRALVLIAVVVLCGCKASAPNIVGTWQSSLGGALTTYHFRPDNTFTFETLFDGYHATVSGKYRFENDMFYMDPGESNVEGSGPDAESIRSSLTQASRLHYQMYGKNSWRLGAQDPPLVLTRIGPSP